MHERADIAASPRRCGRPDRRQESSPASRNTDFLQAVSLFHTRDRRRAAEQAGKQGKELPAVTGNRQALLNLPLEAYKKYEAQVERGFVQAAKFLHMLHIYRIFDLPYQSQIVPLAAILADIGDAWEHEANRAKLVRWYWNGVFGELYGSASRLASHATSWRCRRGSRAAQSRRPSARRSFRSDRLKTMRMRLSAAYKGVNALLMKEGAQDFRSGQKFDHTVFFGENVDIHHIFPQDWCKTQGIKPASLRLDHQQDAAFVSDESDHRRRCAVGLPGEAGEGQPQTPPIDPERLDAYPAIASDRPRPAARRSIRRLHGRSTEAAAGADRASDREGCLRRCCRGRRPGCRGR